MNKVIAKIIGVLSFLILVVVMIFYLLDLKKRKDVSDSIINFFKNGVSSSYLDEDSFKQLTYATTKDVNNYNITKFVNDYKEILHNCIISKIDPNKVMEYSQNHYTLINHNVGEITIYAMDSSAIKFIKNKLTDNDINEYLNGTFDSKIENQLKKVFLKNNKDEWFLIGDKDKIIDLQYNIYLRYVSNKKENNYDDISFIDMKIKKSLNKNYINGQKRVPVLVRYKDNNGEIHTNDADLLVEYDEKNNLKINLYYFFRTFYKNANGASITVRQHDADIAEDLGNLSSARTSTWSYSTDPEFAYPDDSTEELREEEYYQSPILTLYEGDDMRWGWLWLLKYKTGEIKYATSLYKMYKIKTFDYNYKDKITYLPYEGIETIEELKERYLNDKERYEADKKWLYEPVELSEEEKKEAAEDKYKWNQ